MTNVINIEDNPREYARAPHYIGAWSYFWLNVLYLLPIIGFIFLIVHSCTPSHENRCHFARSHFCLLAIVLIVVVIALVAALIFGVSLPNLN